MEQGSLEDVGSMNYKMGVREEKWGMLDLNHSVSEDDDSVCAEGDIVTTL